MELRHDNIKGRILRGDFAGWNKGPEDVYGEQSLGTILMESGAKISTLDGRI